MLSVDEPSTVIVMNRVVVKATFSVAATLILSVNAGVLDILRGDIQMPAAPSERYQRVAFVGPARVKEVQGQVERLAGIDRWTPLTAEADLKPGDLVRTRAGTAVLRMQESGSFVKLTPQTILRLADLETGWDRSALSGAEERKGFVVRGCRGKAFARQAGGEWRSVEVNAVLAAGEEIRTEPETVLDLFSTVQKRPLRVRGATVLKLKEATFAERVLMGSEGPELLAVNRR